MRRRLLYLSPIEGKPIIESNYADICYYNSDTEQFVIVDVADIDNYTDTSYTPIGIVAVPSSHTDNQRPHIMSLVYMNCDTPDNGSTNMQDMYWGGYGYVVSGLEQKQGFPYIGTSPNSVTTNASVKFQNSSIYLPSDSRGENGLNGWFYINPSNYNEYFYYNSANNYMCSPYKQDGSKDDRYFSTSNTGNVLADFDGQSNTEKILSVDNSHDTSWQTASTINNESENQYIHPAAQCCWRFRTVGTNQGDWYLPSAGELGYAIARMQAIQNSMKALVTKGYTVSLLSTSVYWSSTQYSNYVAVYLHFDNGYVNRYNKFYYGYVRAFLAL